MLSKQLSDFIRRNKLTRELSVTIYNTVLFPSIVHGLKVRTLTRQNRRCLRRYERVILGNMVRYSKTIQRPSTTRELLHGRTITRRIKVMRICYWGHICRRPRTHMLQLAKNYCLTRRKIGRPSYTYKDSLQEAFSKYPIEASEWNQLSSDKVALKQYAENIYAECNNDTSSDEDPILT